MASLVFEDEFSQLYHNLHTYRRSFDDEAYDVLNDKYNIEKYTTRHEFLNYVFSKEKVNEYCNYLLSLKDERYKIFVWEYLYMLNDYELVGDLKKLYDKFKIDEAYFLNHNNNFIERNKTKSIKNEIVKIAPLNSKSAWSLVLDISEAEESCGFYSYIIEAATGNYWDLNEDNLCFEIRNIRNEIVGAIGITPEQKGLGACKNTYALFYYITPNHRNKGYATNAIKLILELIKEKKIYREDLDPKYERRYVKNRIDVNLLNVYIKANNIYSNKIMESLGIYKTGMFKTYTGEDFIDWYQYQITFD